MTLVSGEVKFIQILAWDHSCVPVFTARPHCRIARNADRCILAGGYICLSVCPPVHVSGTFRCFVQMNEDRIMWYSASGRTILLVPGQVQFIWLFAGIIPSEGVKVRHSRVDSENLTYNQP